MGLGGGIPRRSRRAHCSSPCAASSGRTSRSARVEKTKKGVRERGVRSILRQKRTRERGVRNILRQKRTRERGVRSIFDSRERVSRVLVLLLGAGYHYYSSLTRSINQEHRTSHGEVYKRKVAHQWRKHARVLTLPPPAPPSPPPPANVRKTNCRV